MADLPGPQANTSMPDSEDQAPEELRHARELRQQRRQGSPIDHSSLAQNVAQASKNKVPESFGGKGGGQGEGVGTLPGGSSEMFSRANKQYRQEETMKAGMEATEKLQQGDISGAIKGAVMAAAEMAGQLATGKLLQFMWENIYYVLPLLYIDFHFVMRYIASQNGFCAFGSEWSSKAQGKAGGAAGQVAQAPGRMLEIIEMIAMVLCNFIVIFALLCIWLLIYALATPCDTAKLFLGGFLGDIVKGILNLVGKCS